jgi:hypothetical protein
VPVPVRAPNIHRMLDSPNLTCKSRIERECAARTTSAAVGADALVGGAHACGPQDGVPRGGGITCSAHAAHRLFLPPGPSAPHFGQPLGSLVHAQQNRHRIPFTCGEARASQAPQQRPPFRRQIHGNRGSNSAGRSQRAIVNNAIARSSAERVCSTPAAHGALVQEPVGGIARGVEGGLERQRREASASAAARAAADAATMHVFADDDWTGAGSLAQYLMLDVEETSWSISTLPAR